MNDQKTFAFIYAIAVCATTVWLWDHIITWPGIVFAILLFGHFYVVINDMAQRPEHVNSLSKNER